jgi:hypothetical protein
MSDRPPSRVRLTVALFLPPLAWFLFQQGLSATMRAYCRAGGPPIGVLWGVGSLILCALAAWLAWPATRSSGLEVQHASRFLALLALIGAGLFALAVFFQTLATLVVPPCVA